MSELAALLTSLTEEQRLADDPATATEIAVLRERWPALPGDYIELLVAGGGELSGSEAMITLFGSELLRRFNDPADQGVPMLADMMVIGVDAGAYWYFYDPSGKLGRDEWAVFVARKATSQLSTARFAGASITHVLTRLLAGESPPESRRAD